MSSRPSEMSRAEFIDAFGGIFEHSPWIAEETFSNGLSAEQDEPAGLHEAMCNVMRAAYHHHQQALIRAHPDLAGKLAAQGKLTEASRGEQASAGLDECTPEELERLNRMNADYVERFGFPFIMAVKNSSSERILAAMEARIENGAEIEFEIALTQIERIALFRLEYIFGEKSE